ncbi:MAG: outer membrane beta-barrel protein [Bacteroidaceae bacterium]|nr:outer membrane beta-barrel protein [Bacteroidaceae bacterium]
MKKSFILMFLTMIGLTSMAQSKFNVSGTIIEEGTNEAILSATVRILSLPDSTMVGGAATGADGTFNIKDVKKGKYAIKVTYIGYKDKVIPFDLTNQKEKNASAGYIHLISDSKLLKEAQVSAAAAKVQVSGDSLVFNASAIRTAEGSALEELVKRLPGATMDADGNIKINGKEVKKILVDGKEFFLNDKEMALKNIPTNIVDKIKAYDRKSDLSRVTGIDDGEEETVLDLSLKKGMNQGWFGNLDLGAGTQDRYSTRMNVNRFADQNQYSIIGNLNNVGGFGFGGGGGRWGNFRGGGGGLRTNKDVGGNFVTGNDKVEFGGSIRYRYNGNDTRTESNSINFVTPNGAYTTSNSINRGSNYNVNAQFKLEWKPDSMTNIIFRPSGTISRNRTMSNSANGTYNVNPYDIYDNPLDNIDDAFARLDSIIVNSNISRSQNYSMNKNANGELQVNRRLNNNGRNITLRATGALSNSDSEQLSAASVKYMSKDKNDTYNNRYYNTPGRNHSYSAQLTYSEPIAYKTYLQFSYRYNYSYSKNDRKAGIFANDPVAYTALEECLRNHRYDVAGALDEIISRELLPDYESEEARKLSQFSEYRNYDQTASISFRQVRDSYNFSFGLDFMPQHSKLNYKYMGKDYPEITRTVYNFAPSVDFRYNFDKQTNIRINYRSRTSQPSMTNLLDITDDSNPLNITKGNPGLKPSLNHNVFFNYNTYKADIQQGVFVFGSGGFTQNAISNRTWYDEATGVRTTKPENINGNWNANVGFGWNRGFGADNFFTINTNTNSGFNHNVSYLDPVRYPDNDISATNTVNVGENISLGYRKNWFEMSINGNVNYRNTHNNIVTTNNRSTWDFSYGTDLNFIFDNGLSISTDISESSRRGYSSKDMNTNELLWNMQVSQSFLKGKALTISLQWNDILRQQSNISRTISAMSQSDSRSNAIYSYGMIHVIYKLNIFGKGAKMPQMGGFGRGGFPGGGFPGGGFGGGRPR